MSDRKLEFLITASETATPVMNRVTEKFRELEQLQTAKAEASVDSAQANLLDKQLRASGDHLRADLIQHQEFYDKKISMAASAAEREVLAQTEEFERSQMILKAKTAAAEAAASEELQAVQARAAEVEAIVSAQMAFEEAALKARTAATEAAAAEEIAIREEQAEADIIGIQAEAEEFNRAAAATRIPVSGGGEAAGGMSSILNTAIRLRLAIEVMRDVTKTIIGLNDIWAARSADIGGNYKKAAEGYLSGIESIKKAPLVGGIAYDIADAMSGGAGEQAKKSLEDSDKIDKHTEEIIKHGKERAERSRKAVLDAAEQDRVTFAANNPIVKAAYDEHNANLAGITGQESSGHISHDEAEKQRQEERERFSAKRDAVISGSRELMSLEKEYKEKTQQADDDFENRRIDAAAKAAIKRAAYNKFLIDQSDLVEKTQKSSADKEAEIDHGRVERAEEAAKKILEAQIRFAKTRDKLFAEAREATIKDAKELASGVAPIGAGIFSFFAGMASGARSHFPAIISSSLAGTVEGRTQTGINEAARDTLNAEAQNQRREQAHREAKQAADIEQLKWHAGQIANWITNLPKGLRSIPLFSPK